MVEPIEKTEFLHICVELIERLQCSFEPSREMSLTITKLQEAGMWAMHIPEHSIDSEQK